MSELDDTYYDFFEFQELLKEVTSKLNRAAMMQHRMHWQFGDLEGWPDWYQKFIEAMDDAKLGWMSSNC
jgi:hypothetical protein